jgi:hypothetical protein
MRTGNGWEIKRKIKIKRREFLEELLRREVLGLGES